MPSRRSRVPNPSFPAASAAALVCVLWAAPALAEPEPVQLAWVRGPGADACPSGPQIAALVRQRFSKSPFTPDAARSIDAYVTHAESGWRAQIYIRNREGALAGSRELTSDAPDCASIEAAAVLVIALAIDPEAGLLPATPPLPVTPPPITPPLVPPSSPSPPAPMFPPDETYVVGTRRPTADVMLRGGAGWGLLPRGAPGAMLAAHLAVSRWMRVTAEALWMPERRTADGRFGFGLSAFALGACLGILGRESVDLAACGSLWGGALHAVVYQLTPTQPGDHPWAAAALSPRLRITVAQHLDLRAAFQFQVHLEAGFHLFVPLIRQPFTVTGEEAPAFQESPVAILPFVGLGAKLP